MKAAFTAFLIFFLSSTCLADFSAGIGMNSVYTARRVPGIHLGISGKSFGVFGSTSGVRSSSYFHNSYVLNFMKMWSPGDFWWGKLTAGFGVGIFYATVGYKPANYAVAETYRDWTAGPALRLNWLILKPVFVAVDAMYGIRNPLSFIAMYSQDIASLSFGIQL